MATKTKPIRAVFDTNIYVAAFLSNNPNSPNMELINRWLSNEFVLVISDAIIDEIVEKFNEKGISQDLTTELVANLMTFGDYVEVPTTQVTPVISVDPKDDLILASAVAGSVDYLVTYDPHFDCLGGKYKEISIIEPIPFLWLVRKKIMK